VLFLIQNDTYDLGDLLRYKGFFGKVYYYVEEKVFVGELKLVEELVVFRGKSIKELDVSFKSTVDQYVLNCEQQGIKPNLPEPGNIEIKIAKNLHEKILELSTFKNKSIERIIEEMLLKEVEVQSNKKINDGEE